MYNKKQAILKDRALMFQKARSFFYSKNVLEVDPPAISKNPSIDTHIDVMETFISEKEIGYLHTSPEYLMKRLLSEKLGDIYFLGHVFRKNEIGSLHNPEFSMVEWYRKDLSYKDFILEVLEFIKLFIPFSSFSKKSYRETFFKYTQIDYVSANIETLKNYLTQNLKIDFSSPCEDKDTLLNLIMTHLIEPHLGVDELFVLDSYPVSQAALAKTEKIKDEERALRFEVYFKGIELANGFHELEDAQEQRKRLIKANQEREILNKKKLPIDEKFLKALEKGFGNYFGVAVGFDRLMMMRHQKTHIKEVIPFSWDET